MTRRRVLFAAIAAITVCTMALLTLGASAKNSSAKKTYNIYYSTSFNGNGYRVQSVNTMLALLKPGAALAGRAKMTVVVSPQNTPASQIASLHDIILKHPDAIIIQPSVSAALAPVIQQACNAGIVVGVWDSPVPNKCVYGWFMPIRQIGVLHGQWLAKAMHGHGVLFQDQGLAGVLLAKTIIDGEDSVFKKYPGIKIVKFYGQFATGPTVQGVSALLTAHPDVAGVDDMAFIAGAFTAFERAHHALVPMSSMPYNAGVIDCVTLKGANCGFTYWPAYQAAYVLRTVLDVLDGKKQPHTQLVPTACVTTDGGSIGSLKCSTFTSTIVSDAKLGSPEGAAPVTPPWANPPVTAKQVAS